MTEQSQDPLVEFLWETLPAIDSHLDQDEVEVADRPFRAALLFMRVFVKSVSTGSVDDFIRGPHFAIIVNRVIDWYFERYGDLTRKKKELLRGIVHFRGQPVGVTFPVTTGRVETPGETAWLTFPDRLEPAEKFETFFDERTDLGRLSPAELGAVTEELGTVVAHSRRGMIGLMTGTELPPAARSLARTIFPHISKGVTDVLSASPENVSVARWELHLALEKTLKVFIWQFEDFPPIHDLSVLHEHASRLGLQVPITMFAPLPKDKVAIGGRYVSTPASRAQTVSQYRQVIWLIADIASQLERKYSFWNASLLLKKSPWAR
jgi:hypothetical protein